MRVLLVLDSVVAGGAERSTVAMLPFLIERGIEPEVAALSDRPGLQAEIEAAGVPLHTASGASGRIGNVRWLRELIGDRQPQLVHTSLYEADLAGRVAAASRRVPVVSTLASESYGPQHLATPGLSQIKLRASQAIDSATARATRRLHAVSQHVADSMARNLRYPRDRIDVVYRGRPDPANDARSDQRPADRSTVRSTVLVVARHEHVKGIDRALAAMPTVLAAVPDARLLVAGREGLHTATLHKIRAGLGLASSVELLGHRDDVGDLLAGADAVVVPSRREGLPGAMIEAMAASVPVVANDMAQTREVVDASGALFVDAADEAALAGALVSTLIDRDAAAERAGRARLRYLDAFTIEASADAMVGFYRRALA